MVMANGFSGTMDWILPSYAERFAVAGFAVLIFDYRFVGESEGQPRQLIDVKQQREDIRAATHFARRTEGIDPARIALWDTSLGGGHVLHGAALMRIVCSSPDLTSSGAHLRRPRVGTGGDIPLRAAHRTRLDVPLDAIHQPLEAEVEIAFRC